MHRIISAGITPSLNKKRITVFLSFLVQIDDEAARLNGLLHSYDYKGRLITPCIEVLLPHSAQITLSVAKSPRVAELCDVNIQSINRHSTLCTSAVTKP
ncbi:hypothetical protein TNCV_3379341 [Trichonephila clavipes]|nr:hypothetical protein TNCV_3379341 [Trichonephila clavipes]